MHRNICDTHQVHDVDELKGSATLCTMPLIPGVLRYVACGGVRAGWVERASDGRTVIDSD